MAEEQVLSALPEDVQLKFDDKLEQMKAIVRGSFGRTDAQIAAIHYFSIMDPIAALQVLRDFTTRNLDPAWANAIERLS